MVEFGRCETFLWSRFLWRRGKVVKDRYKAVRKRESKLPWREAGPPNRLDDKVDLD